MIGRVGAGARLAPAGERHGGVKLPLFLHDRLEISKALPILLKREMAEYGLGKSDVEASVEMREIELRGTK